MLFIVCIHPSLLCETYKFIIMQTTDNNCSGGGWGVVADIGVVITGLYSVMPVTIREDRLNI